MQNRRKIDLCISGTSSPFKSPCSRISSIDMGSSRKVSATPDAKKSNNSYSIQNSTKWYMKGHKFVTIYQAKKAKPAPVLSLAGTTHRSFNYSNLRPGLFLNGKVNARKKQKNNILYAGLTQKPRSTIVPKQSSSKNLQVDVNELRSWAE